jgi:hypothetical protein
MVPIASIAGVTVKSHPYKKMLEKVDAVSSLEIANAVPSDHIMLWFASSDAILSLLDGGSDFIFNAGSMATERRLEYKLLPRYLQRFGFSEEWMRSLLKSGAVSESVIMLPDLFLIDGTELTVVCRLANMKLADTALAMIGITKNDCITEYTSGSGRPVFYARQDDLLFISTCRTELEKSLNCYKHGSDSLGRSAEFRYMLSRLPISAQTQTYAYLSDPFIRHLTSPGTKIGQLRRLRARAELESIAAAAALRKIDCPNATPTVADLIRLKYTQPPKFATDAKLNSDGSVSSARYGSPASMRTLDELQIASATKAEVKAYDVYRRNYTRFWRRYFDPIAIRLDRGATPDSYSLTTFILPLIDNSIYSSLRRVMRPAGQSQLTIPQLSPAPIAVFSANIKEEPLLKLIDGTSELFGKIGINCPIVDTL